MNLFKKEPCPVCEVLREQLAHERYEKEQLLKYILEPQPNLNSVSSGVADENEPEPIRPRVIPWKVRREMLEAEDREKARILAKQKDEQAKAIAELEKNLGVVSETTLPIGNSVNE
jgi:hypothetical protein